jgi:hypothetical protein
MNMGIKISLLGDGFISFSSVSKIGIAKSYESSIFNLILIFNLIF